MMESCNLCDESMIKVGGKTAYGAVVIYRVGDSKNGWFATLSPKTGGDPKIDFTIQMMPCRHLRFFSEINSDPELAVNYGVAFAKLTCAAGKIVESANEEGKKLVPLGVYAKCKHPDEHIHFKIFPYRGNIGQPFTTDSSFGRKTIYRDEGGQEFVKFIPVKKEDLIKKRIKELSDELIKWLK